MGGADDDPEYGAVEVYASWRADKAVDGVSGADAWDVCEHPVQHADLSNAGDEGRSHLDLEG